MRECAGHGCTKQLDGQVYCQECLSKLWGEAHGENKTDEDRVTDLARSLHDICADLDVQKKRMAVKLPMWMHTMHASALIQAMAHVDEAIRILEVDHRETVDALVKL